MNIGETNATLPVADPVAAMPALAASAAGFADKLAEAMEANPVALVDEPGPVAANGDFAAAANEPAGAAVVPVADVLAVQAALMGPVGAPEIEPAGLPETAAAGMLAEVHEAAAWFEAVVPAELIASGGKPVSDGATAVGEVAEKAAVPAEQGEAADVPEPDVPVVMPAPVAVPVVVNAATSDEGPPGVKPPRDVERVSSTRVAVAVSVTLGTSVAAPKAEPVAGKAKPVAEPAMGEGAESAAPSEKELKPAASKAVANMPAVEPVLARTVEPVPVAAPAAPKPIVAETKVSDPAASVVQQALPPMTQSVDRAVAQPLRTDLPGWEQVLSERIAAELSDDGQEIELSLSPEKLGPLRIKLEMVDGLAQVRIITATPEAARVFTEAQHRLTEGLQRAGIDLGSQSAESGQQGRQTDDRAATRNRMTEFLTHSRRIEAGDAPALRRAASGLVNLMA